MQMKHSSWLLLSVAFGWALGGPVQAETRRVSLEDCIELSLQRNLDIRIQRLGPEIARFSLGSSLAAYDPEIQLRASRRYSTSPGGVDDQGRLFFGTQEDSSDISAGLTGIVPTGLSYSLSGSLSDREIMSEDPRLPPLLGNANAFSGITLTQPLLRNFWIDGPRLNIKIARNQLRISKLTLQGQFIDTITSVELAYLELVAARETVKVQEKALQLAEQLWQENQKRVAVGVLAPLDEKQAESQVASTRAALLGARNTVVIRQNALKSLLDDRFVEWHNDQLEPVEDLQAAPRTFSLQDSWSKGVALRPELLQAKTGLESRNLTLEFRKNQLFPQLDVTGSYGRLGNATEMSGALDRIEEGAGPVYSFGAIFRMPLTNRDARNQHRRAKAELEQALLNLKKIEQQVLIQIHDAVSQAQTSYQQVEATKAAVEYAQAALDAEQKKLENGKSTSFQVLQLQRDLTSREFEHIRAKTDFNAALARLAQAEGTTLERRNVYIDWED